MTNGQLRALIRAIRIINREVNDTERLDKALTEIEEAIEKGDTDDDNLNGNA